MSRILRVILWGALAVTILGGPAQAQQPPFATTKVEGTDNVYIFRYGNAQAMFVVTSAGRDRHRPHRLRASAGGDDLCRRDQEGHQSADPVRDLQPPPLRPHRRRQAVQGRRRHVHRAQESQGAPRALKDPHTVLPDETFDNNRTITLGGTTLELTYLGLNHSDSSLVMRLPKEKIIFAVDSLPVGRCRAAA